MMTSSTREPLAGSTIHNDISFSADPGEVVATNIGVSMAPRRAAISSDSPPGDLPHDQFATDGLHLSHRCATIGLQVKIGRMAASVFIPAPHPDHSHNVDE